ncbi:MAG: TolB family protein [Thermotogota bacterium]
MKKFILITTFIFITLTFLSGPIYQPPKNLKQYSNEYFTFIYEEDLSYLITQLDNFSLELYNDYSEFYETEIDNIQVFILDDVDYVNGFALNMRNQMRLYINSPLDYLGLGDNPNEWIKFVFSHELNHIFYGNTVTDPLINWIPSKTIKKSLNMINQPSSLHEGLSIFMESKYFEGRFTDDLFNTYLTAEILSNKYPRYFYGGGAPISIWSPAGFNYMYGTLIVKKIDEYYGKDVLKDFIFEINSSSFTDISEAFLITTGYKFEEFLFKIKDEYSERKKELLSKGYTNDYKTFDKSFQSTGNIRTDGKDIYYYKESPDNKFGVYKNDELIKTGVSKFDINTQGELVYRLSHNNNNEQSYSLYHLCDCDFKDTFLDNRVVEFAYVNDKKVVYSKVEKGLTGVFLFDLKTNTKTKLIDYKNITLSSFEGDGKNFYFTMNQNSQTDIFYYNINSKKISQITDDEHKERDLFVNDKKLYYSANYEDNLYNIYSLDLETQEINQITKNYPGVFNPVIINNNIYYLLYDSEGYHLSSKNITNKANHYKYTKNKEFYFKKSPEFTDFEYDKNYFESPMFIPAVNVVLKENQFYFGPDILFIGEAVNYTGEIGFYHNFVDDFVINSYIEFDYYYKNKLFLNYQDNNLIYGYSFNSNNQFNLKNKNTINYGAQISFINTNFQAIQLNSVIGNKPFRNKYHSGYNNIFDLQYIQYTDDFNFLVGYSKDLIFNRLKLTPTISYYKNDSYDVQTSLKMKYDLWKPHYALKDGKYRFDGIDVGAGVSYNIMEEQIKYNISLNAEFAIFYWIPLEIPLEYTF